MRRLSPFRAALLSHPLFLALVLMPAGAPARALASRAPAGAIQLFNDGFETGDTSRWPCDNLACNQVVCPGPGATTSASGTTYAPNGTLPLPNVLVFVPNGPVGALPPGAQCTRCSDPPPGSPLVLTTSGADGTFTLTNMPAGVNVPLILQTGKWRRQVTIPSVTACADTALPAQATRLPKNHTEGDMPLLAVSTGGADALECLLRKTGVDDAEFSIAAGGGRVQLFAGSGGTDRFDGAHGGQLFTASTTLWDSVTHLAPYDSVYLSCEGSQNAATKPPAALQAMKDYADLGGRVYADHYHSYWLTAGPAPWNTLGSWNFGLGGLGTLTADVSSFFPRGQILSDWLFVVGASTSPGTLVISNAKHTLVSLDETAATKWIYKDVTANGVPTIQYFSFTTPLEVALDQRCGRFVQADIHTNSGDQSLAGLGFPSGGCVTPVTSLTPEEKLMLFMVFDLGSCIGPTSE